MARFLIFVLMTVWASAGFAAASYDCDVKPHTGKGWIPPRVIIELSDNFESALVLDGLIQEIYGHPLSAKVTRRSDTSLQINWTVENIPVGNVNMKETAYYKAILHTNSGRVSVTAVLNNFDNDPRGTGKCRITKK